MGANFAAESEMQSRPTTAHARRDLKALADDGIAAHSQRFFKTGPGEYAEGDRFIGVRVPAIRGIARQYRALSHAGVLSLLRSAIHEERLLALVILCDQYKRGDGDERKKIYDAYLGHTAFVNNWDLVDASAHKIVGPHLENRSRRPLDRLARSKSLWERRIAIVATFHFIQRGEFDDTLRIADRLLGDGEDLIHKAVGWMLREVGKRDRKREEEFLRERYGRMPRTMLRYAIERFPERRRKAYLKGAV